MIGIVSLYLQVQDLLFMAKITLTLITNEIQSVRSVTLRSQTGLWMETNMHRERTWQCLKVPKMVLQLLDLNFN